MTVPWSEVGSAVAFWLGIAFIFPGLLAVARLAIPAPGLDKEGARRSVAVNLGLGGLLLVAGLLLVPKRGLAIPLVWPVLAVQIWLAVFCAIAAVTQLAKLVLGTEKPASERRNFVLTAVAWIVASAFCWFLPRANPEPVKVLTGKIDLSLQGALALVVLAIATVFAIALSAKSATAKGVVKGVATQIGLLAGTVLFGLPFLFLLVTSFKEDRDMSSAHGIIWVPRVVQTAPVMDDEAPYYSATYKGVTVYADLNKVNPDGTLALTIEHPAYYGGYSFNAAPDKAKRVPREMPLVSATLNGEKIEGVVFRQLPDGSQDVEIRSPESLKGQRHVFKPKETEEVRPVSLRWKNYVEALEFLPPEAQYGLTYLRNTLWLVVMNVLGALISTSLVAYAFARLRFPGKNMLFTIMLSTMMLPAAVTLLPQFLIFRQFGWINTLKPLWVTSWFAAAFNVFLMRQFFEQIPYELEDAAKIDGCSYLRSLWSVMLPQVKPALAVIAIMTFLGAWNNFMGPLVYSSSPETLPISYAVQLFNGERNGDPGLLMAFVTMSLAPVVALFAFAQRFFIEGVQLSGLGGR